MILSKAIADEAYRQLIQFSLGLKDCSNRKLGFVQSKFEFTSTAYEFRLENFCKVFGLNYFTHKLDTFYSLFQSEEALIWSFSSPKCCKNIRVWKPYGVHKKMDTFNIFYIDSLNKIRIDIFVGFYNFVNNFEKLYTDEIVWFDEVYSFTINPNLSEDQIDIILNNLAYLQNDDFDIGALQDKQTLFNEISLFQ